MRVPERNREGQAAQRRNWAGQSELTKQKQHQRIGGGGGGRQAQGSWLKESGQTDLEVRDTCVENVCEWANC